METIRSFLEFLKNWLILLAITTAFSIVFALLVTIFIPDHNYSISDQSYFNDLNK